MGLFDNIDSGTNDADSNDTLHDDQAGANAGGANRDSTAGALAGVLSLPGVQDLVLAARRGERMRVLSEADYAALTQQRQQPKQDDEPAPEPDPNWAELDNAALAQQLQKKVVSQVGKAISKTLADTLSPLQQQLDYLMGMANQHRQSQTTNEVSEAMKRHPDLPRYQQSMLAIHKDNPSLSVEELYILAKTRAGHNDVPVTKTERPTNTSAKPSTRKPGDKPVLGSNGFRNLVGKALAELNTSQIEGLNYDGQ
jgi:hypothetical protein